MPKEPVMIVEIMGPSGRVHYRRPLGHPLAEEALRTPGYSIRYVEERCMLKLFEFSGAETEWVAASNEAEARQELINHYGITERDVAGSYESVSEVDPSKVKFGTDVVDAETEEEKMTTAAEIMSGKTKPFIVGSTCY